MRFTKLLSVFLAALMLFSCVAGALATGVVAADEGTEATSSVSYTNPAEVADPENVITWYIGYGDTKPEGGYSPSTTIIGALTAGAYAKSDADGENNFSNNLWPDDSVLVIKFKGTQDVQKVYTNSDGKIIGNAGLGRSSNLLFDCATIFRENGTKLPIVIEGADETAVLNFVYLNDKGAQASTFVHGANDYFITNCDLNAAYTNANSSNKFYAGSGNIILDNITITQPGSLYFYGDSYNADPFYNWNDKQLAANRNEAGHVETSITLGENFPRHSSGAATTTRIAAVGNSASSGSSAYKATFPSGTWDGTTTSLETAINGFKFSTGLFSYTCRLQPKDIETSIIVDTGETRITGATSDIDISFVAVRNGFSPVAKASVIINSGTVQKFYVDGASTTGNKEIYSGDTEVIINGGHIHTGLYGLHTAYLNGDFNVELNGGKINYFYAVNDGSAGTSAILGDTTFTMTDGTATGTFYCGIPTLGTGHKNIANISGGLVDTSFYGSRYGGADIENNISGEARVKAIFCGANNTNAGTIANIVNNVSGGVIGGYYGGGNAGTVTNVTNNITGGSIGEYYGGANGGSVTNIINNINGMKNAPYNMPVDENGILTVDPSTLVAPYFYGGCRSGLGTNITNNISGHYNDTQFLYKYNYMENDAKKSKNVGTDFYAGNRGSGKDASATIVTNIAGGYFFKAPNKGGNDAAKLNLTGTTEDFARFNTYTITFDKIDKQGGSVSIYNTTMTVNETVPGSVVNFHSTTAWANQAKKTIKFLNTDTSKITVTTSASSGITDHGGAFNYGSNVLVARVAVVNSATLIMDNTTTKVGIRYLFDHADLAFVNTTSYGFGVSLNGEAFAAKGDAEEYTDPATGTKYGSITTYGVGLKDFNTDFTFTGILSVPNYKSVGSIVALAAERGFTAGEWQTWAQALYELNVAVNGGEKEYQINVDETRDYGIFNVTKGEKADLVAAAPEAFCLMDNITGVKLVTTFTVEPTDFVVLVNGKEVTGTVVGNTLTVGVGLAAQNMEDKLTIFEVQTAEGATCFTASFAGALVAKQGMNDSDTAKAEQAKAFLYYIQSASALVPETV